MKRLLLVPVFLCLLTASAFAQRIDNLQVLRDLGLTEDEINRIIEIQEEKEKEKREAQIELNLYKAQLEKLLFPADIDMKEVERLLRESMECKLKYELAEIRSRVAIRKILGEERWTKFLRVLKKHREGSPLQPGQPGLRRPVRP